MSELRWILLVVGVLFLISLTAWESRRSRLARVTARERARAVAETFPFEGAAALSPLPPGPALGELPTQVASEFSLGSSQEYGDGDDDGDGDDGDGDDDGAIRAERHAVAAQELPSVPMNAEWDGERGAPFLVEPGEQVGPEAGEEVGPESGEEAAPESRDDAAVPTAAVDAVDAVDAAPGVQTATGESAGGISVEWPAEEQRRVVAVRIVSTGEQRLSGRTTRQALAACGFVHGRYRIFHQPDAQGHALLSCASLNKPGVFDPASMDYQRYSGLSLFTVLPGPLSAPEAVDRLLHTALDLSQRLQARLQDDEGQTLDASRIEQLRTRYRELDAMAGPPA